MKNPLLEAQELPLFSQIKAEHVEPALDAILKDNRQALAALLAQQNEFNWQNLVSPQEALDDRLNQMWSPVNHLNSVMNSDELRSAYNACLPKLSAYATEIGHNQKLFHAYKSIKDKEHGELDHAQQKIIDNTLRDFRLSGIALNDEDKKIFAELDKKLSQLTTKFEENLLDATHAWELKINDKNELTGLTEHALQTAKEAAAAKNIDGYLLTLEFPCYYAVMTYCDNRQLREKMYQAYCTRASNQGPNAGKWDNEKIIEEILKTRLELAKLLGFDNFAERSLATKMADTTKQVLEFLENLAEKSAGKAKQEFEELSIFAKQNFGIDKLLAWDVGYYSEKLRQQLFDFSEEDLRPYFPLSQVLDGMFTIINKLYGMSVEELKNVDVWHEDVRCFAVKDEKNQLRGKLYMDLYARTKKRGGAWMDECRNRRVLNDSKIQNPVAYLTCNFGKALQGKPSLLTHQEVVTLFHEFGHCLHHLLTQVNYSEVAGINGVAWDAVELPSQFFENFCWADEGLALIAKHYETDKPLPAELKNKMLKAKKFQSGLFLTRQLTFALFDFELHLKAPAADSKTTQDVLDKLRERLSPFETPEYNRFQNGFSHIFAGGYAAGYYSYLWADVLAQDAFSKFKKEGVLNPKTGREFLQHILEKGGSAKAMDLFVAFRGREPKVDALLESYDIL